MDVLDIITDHLAQTGGVGLFLPGECGCGIDDLAPCGHIDPGCEVVTRVIDCPEHGRSYAGPLSDRACGGCGD